MWASIAHRARRTTPTAASHKITRGFWIHRAVAAHGYCDEQRSDDTDGINGQLVTRVAMGIDVLARLNQQIQKALIGMRDAKQAKPKS